MKKLLLTLLAALLLFSGCAAQKQESQPQQTAAEQTAELEPSAAPQWEELRFDTSLPLSYATQFSVRYAEGGYTDIPIDNCQNLIESHGCVSLRRELLDVDHIALFDVVLLTAGNDNSLHSHLHLPFL